MVAWAASSARSRDDAGNAGVLVELPAVIDGIQPGRIPVDVDPRITRVAGDLFTDPVPAGDAYVLSTVLWLFDDQRAVLLQHNIKSAVPDSARVLVLDFVHPPGPWIPPSGLAGLRVNPVVAARDGYSWVAGVAPEESRGPTAELMLVVAAGSIYIEGFPHPRVEDDAHDAGSRQNCR